jgi:hypothetical protein
MTMLELAEAERRNIVRRLGKLPKKKKRHAFTPSAATAKALREGGVAEKDITALIEGAQHERNFLAGVEGAVRFRAEIPARVSAALDVLQEQMSSGASADGGMMPPTQYGWTESAPGDYAHSAHGSLQVRGGRFTHRDRNGVIRGSGNQEAMDAYVRGLKAVDVGGSPAASEGLEDILTRVRNGGTSDTVPAAARTMVEARLRPSGPDLTAAHAVAAERLGRSPRIPAEAVRLVEEIRAREAGRTITASGDDLHAKMRGMLATR